MRSSAASIAASGGHEGETAMNGEPLGFFAYLLEVVMPQLIAAVPITLTLTAVSFVIGNLLALPIALARVSRNPLLRAPAYAYILFMRGTPLLVQLYLTYYGFKQLLPVEFVRDSWASPILRESFWYAILAFSLNTAGYTGEILRGAIQSVPHGEIEAGRAFGMTNRQIFWRITLPRAIRICLPTMSGETILLLKVTSLASVIAIHDVMGRARYLYAQEFRIYEALLGAAIIYFVLVFALTRLLNWTERRLNRDRLPPVTLAKPA
jgi:His/Glu/Gln/Arg/opine family amino acid ABC transporter permease subunit